MAQAKFLERAPPDSVGEEVTVQHPDYGHVAILLLIRNVNVVVAASGFTSRPAAPEA